MAISETISEIDHLDDDEHECIENCLQAVEVCEWCADDASVTRRWKNAPGSAVTSPISPRCMPASWLVTQITALRSPRPALVPNEECAEECERHDADHCQVCAEVLQECAESCRNMMSA